MRRKVKTPTIITLLQAACGLRLLFSDSSLKKKQTKKQSRSSTVLSDKLTTTLTEQKLNFRVLQTNTVNIGKLINSQTTITKALVSFHLHRMIITNMYTILVDITAGTLRQYAITGRVTQIQSRLGCRGQHSGGRSLL